MRTTLTLEDDVAAQIDRRRREHRRSMKEEVNHLLRLGLLHDEEEARQPRRKRFRVEPLDAGELLIDIDDVTAALEIAEGPGHL
jgi:hypothetical protein